MFPFLAVMEFPHSWASERTVSFQTEEEAMAWAEKTRKLFPAPKGTEGRCDITIYKKITEVD